MKYEFNMDDYWNVMDEISEREDVENNGFRQIKIAEKENGKLYVYGYRIVVPELDMTIRKGVDVFVDDDREEEYTDSYVIYNGNEKDPMNFVSSYCNTDFPSIVGMIARIKGLNANPICYINDEDFEFME